MQTRPTRSALATNHGTVRDAQPAIPRTPAGDALRAWLDAFNSADTARIGAYARRFEPNLAIDDERGFRDQTGGFDLVTVERSAPRHLEFTVRERKGPTTAYGMLDMAADEPFRVLARRFQPMGPNVVAATLRIDAATRARTIAGAVARLDTFYVFPDVARRVADTLRARLARGAYDADGNGIAFAMRLDDELAELTHDKHLHLMYSVRPLPPAPPGPAAGRPSSDRSSDRSPGRSPGRSPEEAARERQRLDAMNCGFDRAEVLPGGVGYLKFDQFADPDLCGATASAAMTFLGGTRALILDLRDNGGGDPAMVAYIASYLFDRPTHLNDLWTRRTNTTEQFWTRDSVAGRRFGGTKPVYVLTSARTFSGGEEFTYDLQQLKRATVVGETTGGGAYPMSGHQIDDHFLIAVPFARPVNPVTHANWEGVGVVPDVTVRAADALAAAQQRVRAAPHP